MKSDVRLHKERSKSVHSQAEIPVSWLENPGLVMLYRGLLKFNHVSVLTAAQGRYIKCDRYCNLTLEGEWAGVNFESIVDLNCRQRPLVGNQGSNSNASCLLIAFYWFFKSLFYFKTRTSQSRLRWLEPDPGLYFVWYRLYFNLAWSFFFLLANKDAAGMSMWIANMNISQLQHFKAV